MLNEREKSLETIVIEDGQQLPMVLEEDAPEDMEPWQEPADKASAGRLERLRALLPRFSDEGQKKAAKAIVRFFILILVLTLVARGTAGATLPKVDTTRPAGGEIIQRVRGSGTVTASDSFTIPLPAGLTVGQLLVDPGQSVAEGDALARFDPAEIEEQLRREQAALDELALKLKQLQRAQPHDGSALAAARLALERTQQDYDITVAQGNADIAAAQQAVAKAQDEAQKAWDAIPDKDDETSAEHQAWKALDEALAQNRQALEQANTRVAGAILAAERALADAKTALGKAEADDAEAAQKERDTAAQNGIEASTVQLDIDAQQKKVDTLLALQAGGGLLAADRAGTVQALPKTEGKTQEGDAFGLTDPAGSYEAEMWVDKKDAEKLSPGDLCEVAASGGSMYYRPTVNGTVTAISPAGEDGRAKVTIRLPEGDWKGGQTVEAQIVQDRQSHSLCVPLSALHSSSDGYYLLVLQEKQTVLGKELVAAKVPVTVKAQDDSNAAIEGPVGERDDVITASNKAVQPNDAVRVNPA